jgi:hypothetical protein
MFVDMILFMTNYVFVWLRWINDYRFICGLLEIFKLQGRAKTSEEKTSEQPMSMALPSS